MKLLLISVLALAAFCRAAAQVSVALALDQNQFLPDEAVRVAVKITNLSGQTLHLGADPSWLTFDVESDDNSVVANNGPVPVVEPFDLESSQMATKRVDLQPYFQMGRPGRYKVTATLRIKQWSQTITSPPQEFDIITGAQLWTQNFGVTVSTNAPPEARKYTLVEANYLRRQLRLYLQVSSADGLRVFRVESLGPLVSFSSPEAQVDGISQLHVLWQTGAQAFNYLVIAPDGTVLSRDIYDDFNSRPRLAVTTSGDIVVQGGVRRARPSDAPAVKLPAVPATPAAPPAKP
jgi:hypothetical protein